ncbi:MAG TPA: TRAP transporter TatT component family protein [Pyrinomonadaceae bacterium]|nr:TRAP transporter TatT component family protein [Pyrinomonadaceae bacterium]
MKLRNRPKTAKVLASSFALSALLVATGCRKEVTQTPQGVDRGDANAAAVKVAESDKLYAGREDLSKLRQAVAILRQARIEDYGSFEAAWKLARADYYLGDHTTDDSERDDSFREGEESGKAAIKLNDGKAEGHFWLGANYGGIAKYSTLASLSSVEDIRKEMEAVMKIDEGFQSGSAYMVLGQLYLQAPRFLGGDVPKAIDYLEKGLKFGENNALLRLRLAEAYHAAKRDGDAKKQIDYLMSMKLDPEYAAEYKEAIEQGKKLQEKMK